jgi:hypothetical protein
VKWWKWALVLVLAYALYQGDGDPLAGMTVIIDEIKRGRRVTHAAYDHTTGIVPPDPQTLADQAHVDLDTYAMARMLSSEEGNSSNEIRVACCWALKNKAAREGKSIPDLLLRAKDPNHSGKFGTFINLDPSSPYYTVNSDGKPNAADRYASTALDPYDGDLEIAISVLLETIPDPTGGADQFDRPGGEKNPDAVAAKRLAAGQILADVAGVDPNVIRFWRPA